MLFLVLFLCVTFTASGRQNELQTVAGKIVDIEGQPISKAKVVLYYIHTRWGMGNRITEETESGTDGSFTFKDSLKYSDAEQYPYGRDSYILLASHPDYAFGWKKIAREQEQAGYEIILTEPKSQTITVTDHDGKPLAGARVWPYSVGNRADSEPSFRDYFFVSNDTGIIGAVTDSNGKAVVTHLPKTRCSFHASLKGYATALSFSGDRPIRLNKGATVSGTILDEDGKPVEGALVKFHTEWMWNFILTRTDSQGKFRLEDLPAEGWDMSPWGKSANANGIYVITIEHKDYIASETQDRFEAGQVVEDFDIEAYRGTLIKCHVVDVKTNLPVAGARMRGSNESGRIDTRTDADGVLTVRVMSGQTSISFGSPPEGVYVLRGQNPPESRLRFDAQGEEMTLTLKSPPIAGRLTSVKGKVQLPDGSPAADIKISTTNSAYYETLTFGGAGGAYTGTSSDGSFELKDVPAGLKLFIYGNTKDYQYVLAEVIDNVEDPTVLSEPLVMRQGQVADVLLADKRDESCANLSVKVKPVMWDNRLFRADYHNAKTDADGRLKINGIIPGMKYYVMDSRAESGPRDMYYTQTITLIPLEKKVEKITSFTGIDIEFDIDRAKGKMLLICFWDMNQRPSRNCIAQLAKQAEQLEEKGLVVAAVQASKVDRNKLNEWVKKNKIPFPAGMIQGDIEKIRFAWGVKSLPWLILTDREHIVRAEGFGLDELDEKLSDAAGIASVDTHAAPVSASTSEPSSRQIRVIGVARDRKGKPVAGVEVQRLHGPGPVSTDAGGKFELLWDPARNRPLVDTYYIIARHERENLSAVVEVPEFEQGTEAVNLNLLPGVTFKGKVVDPAGRAIELAHVSILLHTPTQGSGLYDTITDAEGMFEFRGIPTDHKYSFAVKASGHGTKWVHDIYAGHDLARKDFVLEPMTLAIADQSVSGMVVDANDKPISGASLWTDGQGQPNYNARTDAEGKFRIDEVCAGSLRIYATVHGETMLRGYARTYGGATDVRVVVKEVPSPDRRRFVPKTPPSLVGRALPELKDLGIELSPAEAGGKQMLLCFFDLEQRPSRYFVSQLAKQAGQLKNKGVAVVVVQATKVDEDKLNEWIKENNIPFPIGMARDDATKTRFTWGVKSLPWLILTDRKHVVIAEGFRVDELDAKIEEIGLPASTAVDSNKVVGLVKDPQGRPLSGVRVTEFQTDKDYMTDADGRFISAFGPSDERRFFFAVDKQHKLVGVGRLPPGERLVEIKLTPGKMVSGMVVDPDGKPVAGAQVAPLHATSFHVLTDNEGKFDVGWDPTGAQDEGQCFMVRQPGLNLAALAYITRHTETVEIKVAPALTLKGVVEDPNGNGICGVRVGLSLHTEWSAHGHGRFTPVPSSITDAEGRYKLKSLPQQQEWIIYAKADGYVNRDSITTGIINTISDCVELDPIVLKQPILSVSGIVVDVSGKAVANIPVNLWGEGQPELDTKTDADGKFVFENVCSGPIQISAKNDTLFGTIETEGGAKNVKLVVRPRFE